jgi:hypothetical protein
LPQLLPLVCTGIVDDHPAFVVRLLLAMGFRNGDGAGPMSASALLSLGLACWFGAQLPRPEDPGAIHLANVRDAHRFVGVSRRIGRHAVVAGQ